MFKIAIRSLVLAALLGAAELPAQSSPEAENASTAYQQFDGFFTLWWDHEKGRLLLGIDRFDEPFLYQTSMPHGVGSNDLGLDRGQLGFTHVARFFRSGSRVLLISDNLGYRADTDNPAEHRAVESSFAESVLWGFEIDSTEGGTVRIDATSFFLSDAHKLGARLKISGQGSYTADATRSAIYLPRTKSFPDNTEVEAIVTYTGQPDYSAGDALVLPSVVPDPGAVTVHLHHSFVRLPDDGFTPVPHDPRSGVMGLNGNQGFIDYSSQIGGPLRVRYAKVHRLEKTDPSAPVSEAVEPIVYYLDPGAPEPVRSALLEGARWWNQAFDAAGYRNAFQVEMLPEDADPMDVRYNVIQWVHRSTRGWSYGSSVVDPRTGEIIKGHVTLGSLRVRQDYLIAEGLLSPYAGEGYPDAMLEMSLARIRQLSAHEVGHTIGIEHNFAASVNDRASVMDYPFPLVRFDENGELDLSDAYDTGIGEWDKRAVLWAYQDFPAGTDPVSAREDIMRETLESGLLYVADSDARDPGTAHPNGNLWDNGADAIAELQHLSRVRQYALQRFSLDNIRRGRPHAMLEEVLVPIYLLHRFQVEAVGKLLGGRYFAYSLRGDGQQAAQVVAAGRQVEALDALLNTLGLDFLRLPDGIADTITPRPPGFSLTRESFERQTGVMFDSLAPANSSIALTLNVLLDPRRLARMNRDHARDPEIPGASELLGRLVQTSWKERPAEGENALLQRARASQVLSRLLSLAANSTESEIRAQALAAIVDLDDHLARRSGTRTDESWRRFYELARFEIRQFRDDPGSFSPAPPPKVPPGSPIGG